jgi:hypothetical protein
MISKGFSACEEHVDHIAHLLAQGFRENIRVLAQGFHFTVRLPSHRSSIQCDHHFSIAWESLKSGNRMLLPKRLHEVPKVKDRGVFKLIFLFV